MSDTNRKVPGQITLSAEEFEWLNGKQAGRLTNESPSYISHFTRTLFAGLNQSRVGDAAGMVRRSENGSIAVREQDAGTGELRWNLVYLQQPDTGQITPENIIKWPCIKESNWIDRLVEQEDGGVK